VPVAVVALAEVGELAGTNAYMRLFVKLSNDGLYEQLSGLLAPPRQIPQRVRLIGIT
jgi:hypothetical protein